MTDRPIPPLTLVRFDFEALPVEFHRTYPFVEGGVYVYFGELTNMPGHCVVADHKTGQLYSGYHTEHFVALAEEET
ncbi:hypothetical protein [Stratiformator vulcanicus]|uniref:Uncharacterized protein n=1 Tax=Stratiformator vulcanicus TaxID=2527980 RepID=A0A517R6Y4_9PLAN|nr:hypothetical protein [Stratiformator vulcanicus]QDT39625.1 hypothetical protein Pan189_40340 [Stratiformator vulcanicus]